MPGFRSTKGALILAALTLFFLLPSVAGFYTDWLWFKEVGYEAVFSRRISTSFGIGTAVFLVAFIILWANITFALTSLTQPYVMFGATAQGQPVLFNRGQVRRVATIVASLAALVLANLGTLCAEFAGASQQSNAVDRSAGAGQADHQAIWHVLRPSATAAARRTGTSPS